MYIIEYRLPLVLATHGACNKNIGNKLYHWNSGAYNESDYWKISPMIGMMYVDCCGYIAVSYCIGKIVYSEPIRKNADYTRVHTRVYLFSCTKLRTYVRTCSKALTRVYFILQTRVLRSTHAWTTPDARVSLATCNQSVCPHTRVRLHAHAHVCNVAFERYRNSYLQFIHLLSHHNLALNGTLQHYRASMCVFYIRVFYIITVEE